MDKEAVVRAAAALVDQEGLQNLTLPRLAQVLDRHVTSLYNHVDGLEGLRRDLALHGIRQLGERLWEAGLGHGGIDALGALAEAFRRYAQEHPGCNYAISFHPYDEEVKALWTRSCQPIHAALSSLGFNDEETVHAERTFVAAIRGFVIVENSHGFASWPDPDETFDYMIGLIIDGLAHRHGTDGPKGALTPTTGGGDSRRKRRSSSTPASSGSE